jgi:hypothetical protein
MHLPRLRVPQNTLEHRKVCAIIARKPFPYHRYRPGVGKQAFAAARHVIAVAASWVVRQEIG